MRTRRLLDKKVSILQGTSDCVVDWMYNLRFLEKKIRDTEICLFEHAQHQLHNEREDLRVQVFESLKNFFDK
jgi:alpha-beta hydrolase superfamily lysophospholipase